MKNFIGLLLLLFSICAISQEKPVPPSPIPVEFNLGNNRYGIQFLVNKRFVPGSAFSFLTVTSFESDYEEQKNNLDFITKSQVSYEIYKGFGAALGLSVNNSSGLTPIAGLQYVFANRHFLFVVSPTLALNSNKNLQGFALIEYKPAITQKMNLYTRFQGFYNQNTKQGHHDRSYMQFRLGIEIKDTQFGLAANEDYYGPSKLLKENYGAFVRYNFK